MPRQNYSSNMKPNVDTAMKLTSLIRLLLPTLAFFSLFLMALIGQWATTLTPAQIKFANQQHILKIIHESKNSAIPYSSPSDEMELMFAQRRINLHNQCMKHYAFDPTVLNTSRLPEVMEESSKEYLLVDRAHKVLFCRVPFANSLFWKKFFIATSNELADYNSTEQIADEVAMDETITWPAVTAISNLPPNEIALVLQTYTKVMVARNPIDRLISAWRNLLTGYNEKYSKTFGEYIALHYRQSVRESVSDIPYYPAIRLKAFLDFIAQEGITKKDDPAWRPQHLLCSACFIKYDYIAKYETLQQRGEADYLIAQMLKRFSQLNIRRWRYPKNHGSKSPLTYNNWDSFKSTGSRLTIEGVLKELAPDFEIFGYDYKL